MDKFLDRFRPKPKPKDANKQSSNGGHFQFSLPGQKKFQGHGATLGGSKPGKVIEVELSDPGPLGIKVEKRPNSQKTAIVGSVEPNSQADQAGLERGDVLCFQGSEGQEEIPFDLFLQLAKSDQRPLCFEVRRIQTKTTSAAVTGKSAESFSRKQAVIAAAEKREKEAKALNKKTKGDKKALPTLLTTEEQRRVEEERLARMDAAVENQSEAAKEAVAAAKRNEATTAAALGYNPYETNKVTAGQARNATVAATHGTMETNETPSNNNNNGTMAPLPTVQPPSDPSANTSPTRKNTPVSNEFARAYELVVTSNDHAVVASSFSILRKLIVNATTKGQEDADESQAAKFRRVRLGNAKIKAAIVDVEGGFDLMSAVGFQLVEEDGESFLAYPKGRPGEEWLSTALAMMESYETA